MSLGEIGVHLLVFVFAIGALGCLITIPLCAFKFFAVLLEKEPAEPDGAEI